MEIDTSAAQFNLLDGQYMTAMTLVSFCSNFFTVTLESKCIMLFVLVKFCFLFLVNPKAVLSALLVMLIN